MMSMVVQLLVICLSIYETHGFAYRTGSSSWGFSASSTTSSSVMNRRSQSTSTAMLYEGEGEEINEEERPRSNLPQNQTDTHAHDGPLETLELSNEDMKRFEALRRKCKVIPILIMDAMLPGQNLEFGSNDPKFRKLVEFTLQDEDLKGEAIIGMIGLNPYTQRPLNLGVTLNVNEESVNVDVGGIVLKAKGDQRFQVQGEPWLDVTESFYLAEVEMIEKDNPDREEILSVHDRNEADRLAKHIPSLVQRWKEWVVDTGKCDKEGMDMRVESLGEMPASTGDRAIWTAALVNPLPPLGVCLEIRPAMLACKNDLDRVKLAAAAIQSSIDHLSGKKRLF